jgi:hypothetical protein
MPQKPNIYYFENIYRNLNLAFTTQMRMWVVKNNAQFEIRKLGLLNNSRVFQHQTYFGHVEYALFLKTASIHLSLTCVIVSQSNMLTKT